MEISLKKFLMRQVDSTFNEMTDILTKALRVKALERGWPLGVVLNLFVVYDPSEDGFEPFFPDEYAQKVDLLEYGDRNTPPNAVIRPFLIDKMGQQNLTASMQERFEQSLLDRAGVNSL